MSSSSAFDLDRIGGRRSLDALVLEILAAGEEALRLYRSGVANRAETKLDKSPVTEADRAVEARLRSFLMAEHPGTGFLGEESGTESENAAMKWIVDPIDGTRAFLRGLPTWSILLTLEADGIPVVGVAYLPAAEDLFVGVRGGGTYANGRPVRLSKVASLESALVCHGGLQQFTAYGHTALLSKLGEGTFTQRGFADFDGYRQMLLGRADAMVDPGIQPYDVGPAAVLIEEAGGTWSDFAGERSIYSGTFVASNGPIHAPLLALLRR